MDFSGRWVILTIGVGKRDTNRWSGRRSFPEPISFRTEDNGRRLPSDEKTTRWMGIPNFRPSVAVLPWLVHESIDRVSPLKPGKALLPKSSDSAWLAKASRLPSNFPSRESTLASEVAT